MADHRRGRAHEIGLGQHLGRALGVGQDLDPVPLRRTIGPQLLAREALVHLAMPLPEDDLDVGLRGHVLAQELVGQEDHPVDAQRLDHRHRVGRGAADVRLGLHRRRGVDVGHHRHARVALPQQADVRGRDRRRQRAARQWIGDQHRLLRRQDLRRLGHEVDAGQHDHLGVRLRPLLRQGQRVAHEVGDAVKDLRRLVVVGEDDGVPLPFELVDGGDVGSVDRPLQVRDHRAHLLVDGGGHPRHLRRVVERSVRPRSLQVHRGPPFPGAMLTLSI